MFAHIKCYKVTKYVMTIEQIANVHVPSRTKFRIAVVWKNEMWNSAYCCWNTLSIHPYVQCVFFYIKRNNLL